MLDRQAGQGGGYEIDIARGALRNEELGLPRYHVP
jgi:hypothetical protein